MSLADQHRRRGAALALLLCTAWHHAAGASPPKRPVPDYDGRGDRTTPSEVALWVPRLLLSPLYLVTEYGIRRPLGFLIAGAERSHLPEALYDFFILSKDRKIGWAPTALVDFGFKPSVGIYFFWDDAIVPGNDVRIRVATWGTSWLLGAVTDRVRLGSDQTLSFQIGALRRPDFRYYGEGPNAPEDRLSRYGSDWLEASAAYSAWLWRASSFEAGVSVRKRSFHNPDETYLSTRERATRGDFLQPETLDTGYTAGVSRIGLRLDSRERRQSVGSGARLQIAAEHGGAPQGRSHEWIRYGAIAGGFLDLNQRGRVVSLSLATLFSDPLGDKPVPFTELVQLGGDEPMRGFLPGRLFGRSAAVATLGYHWPVWVWLNGTLQAAVGNVFDAHLNGLEAEKLRFSGAIGLETAGVSDNPVEILLGFGTETFEDGAKANSLRAVFGTSHGF